MKKQTATLLFRADEFIIIIIIVYSTTFFIIILHVGLWLLILDPGQFFYEWMYDFFLALIPCSSQESSSY